VLRTAGSSALFDERFATGDRRTVLVCLGAMVVLVPLLLWSNLRERKDVEWWVKPASSATFVVAALVRGALGSTFGRIVLAGLVLAAAGDVLLIPKDKRAFVAGIGAFLLGHVAYAIAFVFRGVDPMTTGCATVVLVLVAIPVLRWLWPNVSGSMRIPVAAYVVVITAMVALAAGTARRDGLLLFVGAFGFYLSDLSVARDRFVKHAFANRAWGLPLYFFSQLLLASQVTAGR
jgi:uncharacterized membrane protein YhhN